MKKTERRISRIPGFGASRLLNSLGGNYAYGTHDISRADIIAHIIPAQEESSGPWLESMNACYEKACVWAGGDWDGGCFAPKHGTPAQKAAIFLAWQINAQGCLWGGIGKTLLGLWG